MSVSEKELQAFADREGVAVSDVEQCARFLGKIPTPEKFWEWVAAEEDRCSPEADDWGGGRYDPDGGSYYY